MLLFFNLSDLCSKDLGDGPFHAVGIGEAEIPQPTQDANLAAALKLREVTHPVALEGSDLVPRGFDDRFAAAILEGVISRNGKPCELGVTNVLNADVTDNSAKFYFV